MKHIIRKLLYVLACAIPVYISAAGLGTPVSGTYIQYSQIGGFMTTLWGECSAEPLSCIDNISFQTYNLDDIVTGVASAQRDACKADTTQCNITVADVIGDAGFGETEPNNLMHQADALTRDVPVFGQLSSRNDVDWFSINTYENNTAMNIWLAESDINSVWLVTVTNSSGATLAEFTTAFGSETNFKVQAPNAGKQYVKVQAADPADYPDEMYQMAVSFTGAQGGSSEEELAYSGETEPNDHIYSADLLGRNQTIVGQSYSALDVDWYLVETRENNTLLEFWFGASASEWNVQFTDSTGSILAEFDTPLNRVFSYQVQAGNLGNYYLRIAALGQTSAPYQVTAVYLNEAGGPSDPNYNFFDVERENNDTFSRANTLGHVTSTIDVKGQILNYDDLDLFRIDSSGNEIITVHLCPEASRCALNPLSELQWALYLFDGRLVNDAMLNPYTHRFWDESLAYVWVIDSNPGNEEPEYIKEDVPGYLSFTYDHLYYLAKFDVFGDGLMGMVDPVKGKDRSLSFAIREPGSYYIGVSSLLEPSTTYASWQVVSRVAETQYFPDELWIVHRNFTTDEYTFRVNRTGRPPVYGDQITLDGKDTTGGGSTTPPASSSTKVKDLLKSVSTFF